MGLYIAPRQKPQRSDVIVVLVDTRGQLAFLHEKIDTAIRLYKRGFAPYLISQSIASAKVSNSFKQIKKEEVDEFVKQNRITPDYADFVHNNFDLNLGADYIKTYAVRHGVPRDKILTENRSLHTKEHADFILPILKENGFKSIILVTAPFHMRRSHETFCKVLISNGITVIPYSSDSTSWSRYSWFLSKENIKLALSEIKRLRQYGRGGRSYIPRS